MIAVRFVVVGIALDLLINERQSVWDGRWQIRVPGISRTGPIAVTDQGLLSYHIHIPPFYYLQAKVKRRQEVVHMHLRPEEFKRTNAHRGPRAIQIRSWPDAK